ncbi:hypothetical protein FA13DRAFT_1652648 [Coprinellus micaceus]|uniref:Uncharacterized protein n=1 Tax=Coprinellus micaceus TaxID=71717 RepID=A0A4Y7RU95_COPMI|nr:hypothetical protein FA13DRAFT_1652648 [Coprinellus micaceus]
MTDAGDISEAETPPPRTPPATPLRKQAHAKGPLFPSPSPQQQRRGERRKHRRSPSEGVFNMSLSSDEDVAASSETQGTQLLTFARSRALTRPPVTPPTSLSKASGGAFALGLDKVPAPFFASSKFQNSPSPEDLPAGEPAWE